MRQVVILAMLFIQGFALDIHNQDLVKKTEESKFENNEALHLHKVEKRAVSSSELPAIIILL